MTIAALFQGHGRRTACLCAVLCGSLLQSMEQALGQNTMSLVDDNAEIVVPDETRIPFSGLASEQAKKNYLDFRDAYRRVMEQTKIYQGDSPSPRSEMLAGRKARDEVMYKPAVQRLRQSFDVKIVKGTVAGVPVDTVTPANGVPAANSKYVLINLHGGGFFVGGGFGGQAESIPISSLGRIKVITVDYRQAPEHQFPAATEDVAKVYQTLLKQYQPEHIGIYGCSAGGWLTAQSVSWFQAHKLPRPGAVGIFGAGARIPSGATTDSGSAGWLLAGYPGRFPTFKQGVSKVSYFGKPGLDMKSALVSPLYSDNVLKNFPPTLVISGTRDFLLSDALYTHSKLAKLGVDTDLHVWEGAYHCAFALQVPDPTVPETREAWETIAKFFLDRLGR